MQTEGTKQIFVKNFSVLDIFKFASRMPQCFQNFQEGVGGGGMPPGPLEIPSFSFAIPGSGLGRTISYKCCINDEMTTMTAHRKSSQILPFFFNSPDAFQKEK